MAILFHSIRWRNFLSTGSQFTEIRLDNNPITLIVGENGSGKSTILDALCFTLFGKPFRNINKPQLVNSINQKQLTVEVEFSIGTKVYKIVRGIKPTVFDIYLNGEVINQDAASKDYQKYLEDNILKLNYKSFTQIVILGSAAFTPFMQLPASHRREVIEDLLDIKIFSVMNDVLKDKIAEAKNKVSELESKLEVGKTKVKLQHEYILKLEQDSKNKIDDLTALILQANNNIKLFTDDVKIIEQSTTEFKQALESATEVRSRRQDMLNIIKKLADKIKTQEQNIKFYETNDTCPTCTQQLGPTIKHAAICTHTQKIEQSQDAITQLTDQLNEVENKLVIITEAENKVTEAKEKIIDLNSKIIAEQNYIQKLNTDITRLNVVAPDGSEEKLKLKALAGEVIDITKEKTKWSEEMHYLSITGSMLKDTGIKTRIIKQYIPVINKLVNKYLQLMDFYVSFELDESFNETIKSRHRDEFSYASFSEGEKAKIDLSLLLAWRTIAKMKNSVSTNLLILDEIFDGSLDINGTDYVMKILNTLGDDSNVFIISHKDALFDKFNTVIKFEKHLDFSRISK